MVVGCPSLCEIVGYTLAFGGLHQLSLGNDLSLSGTESWRRAGLFNVMVEDMHGVGGEKGSGPS